MYDAIIVGGSYSGIAAALQLARARRKILVVDGGQRRNRFVHESHGFLGRDGADPAAIAAEARAQLLAYPTVEWRDGLVTGAGGAIDAFTLDIGSEKLAGRRVVIATGVSDELPAIPGLAERWGKSVFHCPYCHGYEVDGPIGVLGIAPHSIHHAMMLPDWGPTTFFLNGLPTPAPAELERLAARGTQLETERIAAVTGHADIVLASGRTVPMAGLFTATRTNPSSPLGEWLGCLHDESPAGQYIRTDTLKATTVPGVFACGDAGRAFGNLAFAVGDGTQAGAATHQSLMFSH